MTKPKISEGETKNPFTVHGSKTDNIFTLHGAGEKVATYAIGFVLANSPSFLEQFMQNLKDTNISDKAIEKITIDVEKQRKDAKGQGGRTDIEVGIENNFRLIIEAKRGWGIAGDSQLERYANSIDEKDGEAYLMTISQADEVKSEPIFDAFGKRVPVVHRSWRKIQDLVKHARSNQENSEWENRLLTHLYAHLANYLFQKRGSVCVVPISPGRTTNKNSTYLKVVTEGGGYFHPLGRYPKEHAPEYLGFRWGSQLHHLYKVKKWSIGKRFPEESNQILWSDKEDHMIAYLEGEDLLKERIPSGGINHRTSFHWCSLDEITKAGEGDTLATIIKATDEARVEKAKEDLREFLEENKLN